MGYNFCKTIVFFLSYWLGVRGGKVWLGVYYVNYFFSKVLCQGCLAYVPALARAAIWLGSMLQSSRTVILLINAV
jgi:hypothetical protein